MVGVERFAGLRTYPIDPDARVHRWQVLVQTRLFAVRIGDPEARTHGVSPARARRPHRTADDPRPQGQLPFRSSDIASSIAERGASDMPKVLQLSTALLSLFAPKWRRVIGFSELLHKLCVLIGSSGQRLVPR